MKNGNAIAAVAILTALSVIVVVIVTAAMIMAPTSNTPKGPQSWDDPFVGQYMIYDVTGSGIRGKVTMNVIDEEVIDSTTRKIQIEVSQDLKAIGLVPISLLFPDLPDSAVIPLIVTKDGSLSSAIIDGGGVRAGSEILRFKGTYVAASIYLMEYEDMSVRIWLGVDGMIYKFTALASGMTVTCTLSSTNVI
jgi:hypothetical protein